MMHKVCIPPEIIERVVRRQGKRYAHDDVGPEHTALVVIDMQNYFMAPGEQAEVPMARAVVGNVNRLARALRRSGGLVVWVKTLANEEALAGWSHFHKVLLTPERYARRNLSLREGAAAADLWHELQIDPSDPIVTKTRYSALIPGSSHLEAVLRRRGIIGVWIAGTTTNTCCESTARDAMLLDFRTTIVSDATATDTDMEHNATLMNFYNDFGDVVSTDELIERLECRTSVVSARDTAPDPIRGEVP